MTMMSYVIMKKECRGCKYKSAYNVNHEYSGYCYHPKRNGVNPAIKAVSRNLKECSLLREEFK